MDTKSYKVKGDKNKKPIHKDGKAYGPGETIELTEAQAIAFADRLEKPGVKSEAEMRVNAPTKTTVPTGSTTTK